MSKIRSIKIKNYKSFKDVTFSNLDNFNLLIGANGAGKSHFLDIFNIILILLGKKDMKYLLNKAYSDDIIKYSSKIPENISLYFELEISERHSVEYELLIEQVANKFFVKFEKITDESNNFSIIYKDNSLLKLNPANSIAEKHLYDFFVGSVLYSFYGWDQIFSQIHKCIDVESISLKHNFDNLGAVLCNLKDKHVEIYEHIVSILRMIIPVFLDFEFKSGDKYLEFFWKTTFSESLMPIHLVSEGTLRIISLVTILSIPVEFRPSLILLEEPEIGLHPYAIEILSDLIDNYALDSQVFLTTHSSLLIDRINIHKLYILNIDKSTGNTLVKDIEFNKFKSWLEEYGIGELWRMNILGGTPIWEK
ncbi:AAA family ATPase [Rickettsiales bacterium LUAb2]